MATTTQIDPLIQPYLQYGLQQAQRLYQTGGPQYYPYETFVRPTTTTQTGLQALEARAMGGSPLTQAAQQQLQAAGKRADIWAALLLGHAASVCYPAMLGTQQLHIAADQAALLLPCATAAADVSLPQWGQC